MLLFAERVRPFVEAAQRDGLTDAERECARGQAQEAACAAVAMLDGMFSFVLHDPATGCTLAARDHMGITPLYAGLDASGVVWFASELKGLPASAGTSTPGATARGRVATMDFAPGALHRRGAAPRSARLFPPRRHPHHAPRRARVRPLPGRSPSSRGQGFCRPQ